MSPITDWPINERPRERLLQQGAESLSDAELLAIFIRTGIKGKSAIDLAREALNKAGSLYALFHLNQKEFCQMAGFGSTKYAQLKAVLEINHRYSFEKLKEKEILNNTRATDEYLLSKLGHRKHEVCACLFLDTQYRVIQYLELFRGGIKEMVVYPGEIVKEALLHHATAVILAHNHPSGNLCPSPADLALTERVRQALLLVDIEFLDHLIVGRYSTVSCVNPA